MNFWAYLQTFHHLSWTIIIALVACLASAFAFISYLLGPLHHEGDPEKFDFFNGLGLVSVIVMQLDYPIKKNHWASRLLFGITCLFGILFFSYYSGVLTSLMTSKAPPVPVRNFFDILTYDKKVVVWEDSSNEEYLM